MPEEKLENGAWPHPARLPLGAGWTGHCTAPGHEGEIPGQPVLEHSCNLGYSTCGRRPLDPEATSCDAVRFSARLIQRKPTAHLPNVEKPFFEVRYVCEREHLPAGRGFVRFDAQTLTCLQPHADLRIQKMAECFLESYLLTRHKKEETA